MSPWRSGNASASDVLKFLLKRVVLPEINCKRVYALEGKQHRGTRPPPSLGLGHLLGRRRYEWFSYSWFIILSVRIGTVKISGCRPKD